MIRRLLPLLSSLLVVVLLTGLRIIDPYPTAVLREIAFDFYQRLEPRPPGDFPVRVVDVDEASLAALGQWPWPRSDLARLTDRLTELGAAAIGFDMRFVEPDRLSPARIAASLPHVDAAGLADYDADFAAALRRAPSILGFSRTPNGPPMTGAAKAGFAVSGPDPAPGVAQLEGAAAPLPMLREASAGLAALSLNTEKSATVVRSLPLIWTDGHGYFPTLSLEALRLAFGIGGFVVLGDIADPGYVESIRLGEITIPTTSSGDLWLYYSRPRADLYVSAKDILGADYQAMRSRIEGQIILIGTSASGLLDIHATTLGDNVPGVSIHAQAIEQILSQNFLMRPDWVTALEWVLFPTLSLLLIALVLRLGPIAGLVGGAGSVLASTGLSWWMFTERHIMLDPSFPLAALTLVYLALVFSRFLSTDVAKRQIRRAFGYYVDPALLSQIENSGAELRLGGETRRITVLFSDMRGFTSFSEHLPPERVLATLNTLFGALGGEITARFGTIDKFIGDAIMAYWNAPVDVPDHERRALEATLAMRARLRQLNADDAFGLSAGGRTLGIGIGLNAGDAVVGNMGLETRFDYSALGDTVNVASRVESASKDVGYDIIVTRPLRDAVPDFAMLPAGSLALKGKTQRVELFAMVGDAALAQSAGFLALADAHARLIAALSPDEDCAPQLAVCTALASELDPGLAHFYQLLPHRAADFASETPALQPAE